MNSIEIRTERLLLRPVELSDAATTHEYSSDLENTRFMMYLPYESYEETEQTLRRAVEEWQKEQPSRCEFAIVKGGVHIGGVTLYFVGDRTEMELGWILHRAYWHRGYLHEAAAALIEYARTNLNARRIFACCDSENTASYRAMERLGMRRVSCEGGRRNRSMDEERKELVYELVF